MGRAVAFERPDFHFSEALSAELRLTAERLLRDKAVRSYRARVDLVVYEVYEFQHVHDADHDLVGHRLACTSVVYRYLAVVAHLGVLRLLDFLNVGGDVFRGYGFEYRRDDLVAVLSRDEAEHRFENLSEVHTARNAERVEDDVDRRAVGEVGHIFLRHDARDDALVSVAARHLVAFRDFAELRNVDLYDFVYSGAEVFAVLFAREALDLDDLAAFAVRDAQRRVADFARLFAEYRAQKLLFRRLV